MSKVRVPVAWLNALEAESGSASYWNWTWNTACSSVSETQSTAAAEISAEPTVPLRLIAEKSEFSAL
ncbi:hypothetical protein D3C80_2024340 [compost metagenome]